jgi:hypothetical protein
MTVSQIAKSSTSIFSIPGITWVETDRTVRRNERPVFATAYSGALRLNRKAAGWDDDFLAGLIEQ